LFAYTNALRRESVRQCTMAPLKKTTTVKFANTTCHPFVPGPLALVYFYKQIHS